MNDMQSYIQSRLGATRRMIEALMADCDLQMSCERAARACVSAIQSGGKVLLAGNGGSAADAQHIAGEFVSRFAAERPGIPAISLTTDSSILTAVGNDFGFDRVFARQVEAIGRPGDVLICYSTSGRSPNILRALEAASRRGIVRIGLTGGVDCPMGGLCDVLLRVPSADTPAIQEGHAVLGHLICGLVERCLHGGRS